MILNSSHFPLHFQVPLNSLLLQLWKQSMVMYQNDNLIGWTNSEVLHHCVSWLGKKSHAAFSANQGGWPTVTYLKCFPAISVGYVYSFCTMMGLIWKFAFIVIGQRGKNTFGSTAHVHRPHTLLSTNQTPFRFTSTHNKREFAVSNNWPWSLASPTSVNGSMSISRGNSK